MYQIKSIFKSFGFSENETKVYLAMLKEGEAPVSRIAKNAKLNRITVHHIVERLEKEGLAVIFQKEKQKIVKPAHPLRLQKKIEESTKMFQEAVPELVAIMRDDSLTNKPIVRMYYGVSGFEKVAGELLERSNETIRHIGSLKEAHKFIGVKYDLEYFIPTRIKKNIFYKAIYYKDEEKPILQSTNQKELREVKYFPKNYSVSNNTFIVSNKVVIVTTQKELMSVVIESGDISNSEKEKFDLIWDLLGDENRSPY